MPAEVHDDLEYAVIWKEANDRFQAWLKDYLDRYDTYPSIREYTQRVSLTAKEVLDAIANDDVLVEEHLDINCEPSEDGYNLEIVAVSSIGDLFVLIYGADDFERC